MNLLLARVNTLVYGRFMADRLTSEDWIIAGLRTLATEGASGLKVGALATTLNVSRGSFYWHFRDFAAFRDRLLGEWRDRTVDQVIRDFEDDRSGPDRLKRLLKRAFFGKRGLDRAIRNWAVDEPTVAAIVAAVDARRVGYMAELLIASGVDRAEAQSRAAFLYWAYLGQSVVMDAAIAAIDEAALEKIAGLLRGQLLPAWHSLELGLGGLSAAPLDHVAERRGQDSGRHGDQADPGDRDQPGHEAGRAGSPDRRRHSRPW